MSEQPLVSRDAQFINLNNELRDLKTKQQQTKPAIYFLFAILLFLLTLEFGGTFSIFGYLIALASILAGITAVINKSKLAGNISQLEANIAELKTSVVEPANVEVTPVVEAGASAKLAELHKMLEGNLITQEEFDQKKSEILKLL